MRWAGIRDEEINRPFSWRVHSAGDNRLTQSLMFYRDSSVKVLLSKCSNESQSKQLDVQSSVSVLCTFSCFFFTVSLFLLFAFWSHVFLLFTAFSLTAQCVPLLSTVSWARPCEVWLTPTRTIRALNRGDQHLSVKQRQQSNSRVWPRNRFISCQNHTDFLSPPGWFPVRACFVSCFLPNRPSHVLALSS